MRFQLVLSTGQGVNGFTLDESLGEFILTHPDIRIPSRGQIYSFNEGNSKYFHEPTLKYLESIKYPKDGGKPYSARYIGSMVADVHRTLLYGGIFGYPGDTKSKGEFHCHFFVVISCVSRRENLQMESSESCTRLSLWPF